MTTFTIRNVKFKDANGEYVDSTMISEGSVIEAVDDWLDDHPEATTTVQDGSITIAKLASDVVEAIEDGGKTPPVQWIAQGLMRDAKLTFQGWAHCIRYDAELGKAIGIVMGSGSAHGTSLPLYRVTIDDNGYMSDYEAITFYDTDGTTPYTLSEGYLTCLCRLTDGSYITQCQTDITGLFKSTDKCKTFTRFAISGLASACQLFGMVQLTTGRIIAKCNGRAANASTFAYSDNLGVTWTETSPLNLSGLGTPPHSSESYQFGEPNIIEFSDGKLLAIGRASNNAKSSTGGVRAHKEGAVISYSNDHGGTWSTPVWSTTITDMTACNASSCFANGVYHVALSTRYTYTADPTGTRRYSAMLYHWAKEEDAKADNWSTAVVIDYGHWTAEATTPTDSGYPSIWLDKANNMHVVWYDGDGSGSANGANWRLATANIANNYDLQNEGSGSYVVGYSQKQVEALLLAQKRYLMQNIVDLYEKIGELPPDSGDYDGSLYITDGLTHYFIPADATTWQTAVGGDKKYYMTPKYSTSEGMYLRAQSSTSDFTLNTANDKWSLSGTKYILRLATESNLAAGTYNGVALTSVGINSSIGFTIEGSGWVYGKNYTGFANIGYSWDNSAALPIVSNGAIARQDGTNPIVGAGYNHIAKVISPTGAKAYVNGVLANEVTYNEGDYDIVKAAIVTHHNDNFIYLSTLRYYAKALSAEEVYNNYLYDMNLIAEEEAEM